MGERRMRWIILLMVEMGVAAPVSGWGFDWLKPDTAKCEKFSKRNIARIKVCKEELMATSFLPEQKGSFLRCRLTEASEILVYGTQKSCQQQLDTMRANAP